MSLDTGKRRAVLAGLAASARDCQEAAEKLTEALKPRVLYLEDDADVRRAYKRQIKEVCYLTVVAHSKDALASLAHAEPDLLLTDRIGLPLLDELQRLYPDLPVVVLSGMPPPKHLPDGILAWYHKPSLSGAVLRDIVNLYAKGLLDE